jgi:hypothetical protein
MKCDYEAERSCSVTPRHLLTNSCGESPDILRGCYQPPECPAAIVEACMSQLANDQAVGEGREK